MLRAARKDSSLQTFTTCLFNTIVSHGANKLSNTGRDVPTPKHEIAIKLVLTTNTQTYKLSHIIIAIRNRHIPLIQLYVRSL